MKYKREVIDFCSIDPQISRFVLTIDYKSEYECDKMLKWSRDDGSKNLKLFKIDSLKPLRVWGGNAPLFEESFYIDESKDDILEFIFSLTPERLLEIEKQSIDIWYKDDMRQWTPIGYDIPKEPILMIKKYAK